ncbi:hypothetical protein PTKIN_Ptkin11bG0161100 [Pterospermum kingtungense]
MSSIQESSNFNFLQLSGEDLLKFDLAMSLKADDTELTEANVGAMRRKPEVKLTLFSFASVSAATDKFSASNKLGEGGFGPVYKGILLKGDQIAVKRLSKRSGQGWEELKNEALVIAKLQHKNLVRLIGCCIEKDEKILVYEYMPNKSLDFFLFDSVKCRILNWETRVRIIEGIAQGLLYLHQYSRLRIIHRDLKASNILLDNNMYPKISDFGMARIFGGDELQANTNRIVGTYGYMSPEYALEGLFSIKSDVFSFGVLLLEILSGKKSTGFYQSDSLHLLGYAWDLWTSNRGLELIDPVLEEVPMHLAMRYINIGLLCVQERADDRPTMSDIVPMLSNESIILLSPKQPAFLNIRSIKDLHKDIDRKLFNVHSKMKSSLASLSLHLLMLLSIMSSSFGADKFASAQSISDGETLVSSSQTFELGFFSPGNSSKRFLGIWYKNISGAVVWVANRNSPIADSAGVLTINTDGNLILFDGTNRTVLSGNVSGKAESPVLAQLLDSGNFVVKENKTMQPVEIYMWQSFDYPSDTQLPGMKLGKNLKTGPEWYLTSWKTADDPSPGNFTLKLSIQGLPSSVAYLGSAKSFRTGPWDGSYFGGSYMSYTLVFAVSVVHNEDEIYASYETLNNPIITRLTLDHSGFYQGFIWNERSSNGADLTCYRETNVTYMVNVVQMLFAAVTRRRIVSA